MRDLFQGAAAEPLLTSKEAVAQLRALPDRIPDFVQLPNGQSAASGLLLH